MIKKHLLGVSLLALFGAAVLAPQSAKAADVPDSGCSLQAAVMGGGLLGSQSYDVQGAGPSSNVDDSDWSALFAEAAGLATCGTWNFQGDFAYYDHSTEIDGKSDSQDFDTAATHFGGAVFWREPDFAAFGASGSYISQDIAGKDNDYWRIGLFGEYYANDQFTFGGSAYYLNGTLDEGDGNIDNDGFELAAWGKFYAMPDLSFSLRGDFLNSDLSFDSNGNPGASNKDNDFDYNGFAVTAEAEYLVWDQGLSIFGGGRYASREIDFNSGNSLGFDDLQGYVGVKIALGGPGGTLVARDRSGAYDNTSVMLEKLPNWLASIAAGSSNNPL